jgi:hypothetical protein
MNRFKTPLAAIVLSVAGIGAASAECFISYNTPYSVVSRSIDKTGFNIKNYNKVCSRLKAANMELVIEGEGTVLVGVSVAWANVTVRDVATKVHTTKGSGASTRIDKGTASVPTAEAMLAVAIDNAIDSMNLDSAIAAVDALRKKLKATPVSDRATNI